MPAHNPTRRIVRTRTFPAFFTASRRTPGARHCPHSRQRSIAGRQFQFGSSIGELPCVEPLFSRPGAPASTTAASPQTCSVWQGYQETLDHGKPLATPTSGWRGSTSFVHPGQFPAAIYSRAPRVARNRKSAPRCACWRPLARRGTHIRAGPPARFFASPRRASRTCRPPANPGGRASASSANRIAAAHQADRPATAASARRAAPPFRTPCRSSAHRRCATMSFTPGQFLRDGKRSGLRHARPANRPGVLAAPGLRPRSRPDPGRRCAPPGPAAR